MLKLIAIAVAAATLSACGTPATETTSRRLEREAYAARVAMHDCRQAVAAGQRADCKPEIAAVYVTSQASTTGRYADIGGAGYLGIK